MRVLDLFVGVGGLSYGFYKNQNFKVIAANEILTDMAKAYSLNHQDVLMFNKDIKDFGLQDFDKDPNIDIVIGGPPCQAYSTVGKRLLDDPRGKLFQEYFRILKEFKPSTFLYENVKGLISMNGHTLLPQITSLFETLGYKVKYKLLNAADYGVPQMRERVIIVGTLLDKEYEYPKQTHYNLFDKKGLFIEDNLSYVTLIDAIGDLPPINANEQSNHYLEKPMNDYQKQMRKNSNILLEHNSPNHNSNLINLISYIPEGGTLLDIPENIRPKKAFGNSYSRLWSNRPSTTITRNLGTPSSARCIHPFLNRGLTTREGARLQSFPDNYVFYGSRSSKNLQIGNAVPPILSTFLADSIMKLYN
tara:strand:+ start:1016 stop:2098 length:1083 start_codon:yes stop_codon:yes gene_type:complete